MAGFLGMRVDGICGMLPARSDTDRANDVPGAGLGMSDLPRPGNRVRWLLIGRSALLSIRPTVLEPVLPDWTLPIHGNFVQARSVALQ